MKRFLIAALFLLPLLGFAAVPPYTAFKGSNGIVVITNPPTGDVIIVGASGSASNAQPPSATLTNLSNNTYTGYTNGPLMTNLLFAVQGDSLSTTNNFSDVGTDWTKTWQGTLYTFYPKWQPMWHTNWAVSGKTVATMASENATTFLATAPNVTNEFSGAIGFVWGGFNDIRGGGSAVTTFNNLSNVWYSARLANYLVCAFTIHQSTGISFQAAQEVERKALNNLIRAPTNRWMFDYLCDVETWTTNTAANAMLAPFDGDGIHFNTAGNRFIAANVNSNVIAQHVAWLGLRGGSGVGTYEFTPRHDGANTTVGKPAIRLKSEGDGYYVEYGPDWIHTSDTMWFQSDNPLFGWRIQYGVGTGATTPAYFQVNGSGLFVNGVYLGDTGAYLTNVAGVAHLRNNANSGYTNLHLGGIRSAYLNWFTNAWATPGFGATLDYVWTCTNATTGEGQWKVAPGAGSGTGLQTNADQFAANVVLNIKDGALLTNINVNGTITQSGGGTGLKLSGALQFTSLGGAVTDANGNNRLAITKDGDTTVHRTNGSPSVIVLTTMGNGGLELVSSNNSGGMVLEAAHNLPVVITNIFAFTNASPGQLLTLVSSNNNTFVWAFSNAVSQVSQLASNFFAMGVSNIVAGTNIVVTTNNGTLVINGTTVGLQTNANQFAVNVVLTIKEGWLATNTMAYPSNVTGPAIIVNSKPGIGTNTIEFRNTNGQRVAYYETNDAWTASNTVHNGGAKFNLATASTVATFDASKQLTNAANGTGMLTNDGAGVLGWMTIPAGGGGITGSGTAYKIPKWTSGTSIGDSALETSSDNSWLKYTPVGVTAPITHGFTYNGPSHLNMTGEYHHVFFDFLNTVQWQNDIRLDQERTFYIRASTYNESGGSGFVTNGSTLYIDGPPTFPGTVAVINNSPLTIAAGLPRILALVTNGILFRDSVGFITNAVGVTLAGTGNNIGYLVESRLIATNSSVSNIVINFSQTNTVEISLTNNATFTNWTGIADDGQRNDKLIIIRPQLITRGVNWGNLGLSNPGYSVAIATNANNLLWTSLTNGKTYALSVTRIRTNIFPTLTLWE